MNAAIETWELIRDFNGRRAVDGLTFTVEQGEIFGFLGPNGAGKTTTIRMLTGQLPPTSGRATVLGHDIAKETEQLKALIGVVFEYQNLYERLSARENLAFSAKLYGVDRRRIETVLEQVNLRDRAKERIQGFSNGMKQRLVIARALLHQPKLLFLDEPTRGLDPAVALELRHLIGGLAEQGVTVFLTTHYMEEADQLCKRVAFLNQGKIVALDTPERLKIAYGQHCAKVLMVDGSRREILLDGPAGNQALAELVAGGQVQTIHSGEATLEEVFLQLTGRRLVQ